MCYIDLQHYIHCKHTNAQFRSCWDSSTGRIGLETADHNIFRAEIHSYDRLCGACYGDAVERASEKTGKVVFDPWIEWRTPTQLTVHVEFKDSGEVLEANRDALKERPLGLNQNHDGRVVACMFQGGIDREEALRKPRDAFRYRPTHIGRDGQPVPEELQEPQFISAGAAYGADYVNDSCDPTTNVKEILLYFSACKHFNALWCEELAVQGDAVVARCGCDRFDEKLAGNQYAESADPCLLCRNVRWPEDRSLLGEMVRKITDQRELALWPCSQRRPYREAR
jgi:hypothetical protein